MAYRNPYCHDLSISYPNMEPSSAFIVETIRGLLAEVGITNISDSVCVEARRMCNWDNETGIIVRKWCPHSCGCDLPNSSLILTRNYHGCPNSCARGTDY